MKLENLLKSLVLGATLGFINAQPAYGEDFIRRQSDSRIYSWCGKTNGDYFPSGNNSLFTKSTIENEELVKAAKKVTGGFKEDLKILTHFGTYAETLPDKTLNNLVQKYSLQIDKKLSGCVKQVAKDRYVYTAMTQFLADGGKLEDSSGKETAFGSYYEKHIYVNIDANMEKGGDLQLQKTIYHELLHYIFDKNDSGLIENNAGHTVILALEERFDASCFIRKGIVPLAESICSLYGETNDGKIGDEIKLLVKQNNFNELEKLVNSERLYTNLVKSGILLQLSKHHFLLQGTAVFADLNENQIQDIGYIYAVNAAILQQSLRLAVKLGKDVHISGVNCVNFFEKGHRNEKYQGKFSKFLENFLDRISHEPHQSLYSASFEEMDKIR